MGKLRLGTRGSALALAQARLVADLLAGAEPELEVEVVAIRTSGDERVRSASSEPTAPAGDKARFTREIEAALLRGDVDLAVHSAKDVPGELPDGLSIVGVPERGDPRDAVCLAGEGDGRPRRGDRAGDRTAGGRIRLAELPPAAVVGTSSVRRRSQLLAARPDLDVREVRGNVDTRLRRLAEGRYEALVLATAGLQRLGRAEGAPLAEAEMTPAPGQGCLALEARADDERVAALAAGITHRASLVRLTAERAVVAALGATCHTPVGAFAGLQDGELRLSSFVGAPDGTDWIRDEARGSPEDPGALGALAAARLVAAGAEELLAAAETAGEGAALR